MRCLAFATNANNASASAAISKFSTRRMQAWFAVYRYGRHCCLIIGLGIPIWMSSSTITMDLAAQGAPADAAAHAAARRYQPWHIHTCAKLSSTPAGGLHLPRLRTLHSRDKRLCLELPLDSAYLLWSPVPTSLYQTYHYATYTGGRMTYLWRRTCRNQFDSRRVIL